MFCETKNKTTDGSADNEHKQSISQVNYDYSDEYEKNPEYLLF